MRLKELPELANNELKVAFPNIQRSKSLEPIQEQNLTVSSEQKLFRSCEIFEDKQHLKVLSERNLSKSCDSLKKCCVSDNISVCEIEEKQQTFSKLKKLFTALVTSKSKKSKCKNKCPVLAS